MVVEERPELRRPAGEPEEDVRHEAGALGDGSDALTEVIGEVGEFGHGAEPADFVAHTSHARWPWLAVLVTDYVDGYCERVAPGLWGEPLNSLSNLAFSSPPCWCGGWPEDRTGRLLAVLIGLVFAASTVFHLVATRWAAAADSVIILVFVLVYAVLFARVFLGVPRETRVARGARVPGARPP